MNSVYKNDKNAIECRRKAKEYLKRVRFLTSEIQTKAEQLERLKSLVEGTSSRDYTKQRITSSPAASGDLVCVAIQLEENLAIELTELYALYTEAEAKLKKMQSVLYSEILRKKYLLDKTTAEIAEEFCYSDRHITRLLNSSLDEFYDCNFRYKK